MSDFSDLYRFGVLGRHFKDSDFYNFIGSFFGYTQKENVQKALTTQIDYEQYLKQGNERALADWHRNVPGRRIRYPEFSYPGQIHRANTSIARAGFDYNTAAANYYGNFPYRVAGLYGVGTRLSRAL